MYQYVTSGSQDRFSIGTPDPDVGLTLPWVEYNEKPEQKSVTKYEHRTGESITSSVEQSRVKHNNVSKICPSKTH